MLERKLKEQEESLKEQIKEASGSRIHAVSEAPPRIARSERTEPILQEDFIDQMGEDKNAIFWRKGKKEKKEWQARKGWSTAYVKKLGWCISDHSGTTLILVEEGPSEAEAVRKMAIRVTANANVTILRLAE